jgi:NADH:ubiquinone oxidoreductase subunit E
MKKFTVKICVGTTCFVMGGNNINLIADLVEEKYGDKVTVIGCPCLNQCSKSQYNAPFAKIDQDVIPEATPEKIMLELEKRFKEDDEQ